MTCDDVRGDAAVALLHGAAVDDGVSAHLDGCASCRAEVAALAAVVGLLPLAGVGGDVPTDRPDELGLRRLLESAAATARRRRRRAWGLLAAAAAVVLVLGVGWGLVVQQTHQPTSTVVTMSATDPDSGVSGRVHVTPVGSGSELAFEVSGVAEGTTCRLVVVDSGGHRHALSTWTAEYDGAATVTTTSSVPVTQVDAVQLVDATSGQPLLTLTP